MSSEGHSRDCALSATGIPPTGTIWCVGFQHGERLHGIREAVLGAKGIGAASPRNAYASLGTRNRKGGGGAAHFPRAISSGISSSYPRPKPTVRVSPQRLTLVFQSPRYHSLTEAGHSRASGSAVPVRRTKFAGACRHSLIKCFGTA